MAVTTCTQCRTPLSLPDGRPGPFQCPKCRGAVQAGPPALPGVQMRGDFRSRLRDLLIVFFGFARIIAWALCMVNALVAANSSTANLASWQGAVVCFIVASALDGVAGVADGRSFREAARRLD